MAAPLSQRQRDVLMLLSLGREMKRVATDLGINYATVKTHATMARHKLGARTNEHAVALAVRAGII